MILNNATIAGKISRKEDIRDLFVPNFYFGCEADDPTSSARQRYPARPFAQGNGMGGSMCLRRSPGH